MKHYSALATTLAWLLLVSSGCRREPSWPREERIGEGKLFDSLEKGTRQTIADEISIKDPDLKHRQIDTDPTN